MKFRKIVKRTFELFVLGIVLAFLSSLLSDALISKNAENKLFTSVKEINQKFDVALVLGCKGSFDTEYTNPYFRYRMEACAELYKSGKVKQFLLSGDNGRVGYNEPEEMKKALMKLGIPENCIHLDYAGFRTLDSVIRAKKIFGQEKVLVVSQKFHNERAIYLASQNGIEAYGFNAKAVNGVMAKHNSFREYLARVKAVLDVHIFRTKPKFLGEAIDIT